MHFSPIGAVISWKKQRGLPKSVVDHCHGPCCVGKSFPKPSDWTWEFDRLGSDHRGGCVQWIVFTNRAVNSGQVDRQYRRCQPSVASMWTRNGPSLHNLWKARKSGEIPNLSQIEGTEFIKQSALGESALAVNPRGIAIFVYKWRQARVGDREAIRLVSSRIGIWVDWTRSVDEVIRSKVRKFAKLYQSTVIKQSSPIARDRAWSAYLIWGSVRAVTRQFRQQSAVGSTVLTDIVRRELKSSTWWHLGCRGRATGKETSESKNCKRRQYDETLSATGGCTTANDVILQTVPGKFKIIVSKPCFNSWSNSRLILGLRPSNEKLCYFVMMFLIGRVRRI